MPRYLDWGFSLEAMPVQLDSFENYAFNAFGRGGRAIIQSKNRALESITTEQVPFNGSALRTGVVIRAGAGTYDVVVRSSAGSDIPCMLLTDLSSYYMGVSDCCIPVEGSRVLFYLPSTGDKVGVVIGVVPAADLAATTRGGRKPPQMLTRLWEVEPAATSGSEDVHQRPHEDPKNAAVINANAGRPIDLFPGNRAWMNEQGAGMAILNFLAVLRGSERAKIEVSCLDDLVRLVSGYFRHQTAQGEDYIYNDGGYLTRGKIVNSYQFERYGFDQYQEAIVDSGQDKFIPNPKDSRYRLAVEKEMYKTRMEELSGHLGDMLSLYVCKPDPNAQPETYDRDSKNQGLFQQHVDSSGRLIVRSAAGITLQRWDRIPIPKRKYEPWDPEGDKLEDEASLLEPKTPFNFGSDPYGRALMFRDSNAWRNRMAYQRLHEVSQSKGRTDWYLPEEMDLTTPDDLYDQYGQATEEFSQNDVKQAAISIEPDGSIILRDAWGSEIYMRGGNIVITCPGQLELRPGKSLVQLAGHDLVAKGRKSVDITATDNDVRIKAKRNLHMLAGDPSSDDGGILLESLADGEAGGIGFDGITGEQVLSKGIMLKAKDSRVFMYGKTTHIAAAESILIDGYPEGGDNVQGELIVAVKRGIINAARQLTLTVDDESGVLMTKYFAGLFGDAAYLIGGTQAGVIEDSKYHWPMMKVDMIDDPYVDDFKPVAENIYDMLQVQTDWLRPFDPSEREDIEFTYRSTFEYGTMQATEAGTEAQDFKVYEGSWAYLLRVGYKYITGSVEQWPEDPIKGTYPWPGEVHYTGGANAYVKLTQEVNILDPTTGIPKKREDRQDQPGPLDRVPFDQYEVMVH
jgi:hypothetical protein